MVINKKRKLGLLLATGTLSLVTLVSVPVALTSCSAQSNPYFPNSSISATLNGTKYDFYFVNNTSGNGGIYLGTDTKGKDIHQLEKAFLDAQKVLDEFNTQPTQPNLTKESTNPQEPQKPATEQEAKNNRDKALAEYNAIKIVSMVMAFQNTLYSNMWSLFFSQETNQTENKTSWWQQYVQANNSNEAILKEFATAMKMAAGEGRYMYTLGPKKIEMDISYTPNPNVAIYDPKTMNSDATLANAKYDDKNPEQYNNELTINKYNLTYAWFKNDYTGGTWLEKADTANSSIKTSTVPPKEYLSDAQINALNKIAPANNKNQGYISPEFTFGLKGYTYNLFPSTKLSNKYPNPSFDQSKPESSENQKEIQSMVFNGSYDIKPFVFNPPAEGSNEAPKKSSPMKWGTKTYSECDWLQKMNSTKIIHDFIKNNKNNLQAEIEKLVNFFTVQLLNQNIQLVPSTTVSPTPPSQQTQPQDQPINKKIN